MTVGGRLVADDAPDPDRIATQQDFGRELTAIRARAGLTVRQVARAAGLPVSTTGDYFSGRHLPADGRPEQLFGILRACGETDPAVLARWMSALQRARRPPGRRPGGAGAPYRGLARFEREDAPWFFGRGDVTDLLAALADEEKPLPLVLVGPSEAGKSSVLRAGLVPRLTGPVGLVEPADAPLAALRAALADLDASGGAARPVIIVDQFEAVFTQCQEEAERREFVTELCDLAKTALVILAVRADFYEHALRYPGLAAALQARQVVLGPMTAEQVRRAITEPARLARLDVEDGLVGLLLRDLTPPEPASEQAAYEPGALPLLSHALLTTWEHSRGGLLTVADYLASGGIRDALTRTAEAAYDSLTPQQQQLARRLFLRLVHVADDAPSTRATVRLGELRAWGGESEHVLGRFVAERLITVDADAAQITHDTLLAAWPRLRSWIDAGLQSLLTRRRVSEAARAWQEAGRESAVLWRGSQLATARDWAAAEDDHALSGTLVGEFVAASIAAEQEHRRAERRRTRRLQRLVAALAVLVVAVGTLAGFGKPLTGAAGYVQSIAFAPGGTILAAGSADDTVRLWDVADPASPEPLGGPLTGPKSLVAGVAFSPDGHLLAAASQNHKLWLWRVSHGHAIPDGTLTGAVNWLNAVAFSPDGTAVAAGTADASVLVWNLATRSLTATLPHRQPVTSLAWDGNRRLAAGDADGTVSLWTLPTPVLLTGNAPSGVAYSPDGKTLAAGGQDVQLWDAVRRTPIATRPLPAGTITNAIAYSPDGDLIAIARSDGTAWLLNASTLDPIGRPFRMTATGNAESVAFSPDSRLLATAADDGTVRLWSLADPARPKQLASVHDSGTYVYTVVFAPDGRTVAAASTDNLTRLWDVADPARPVLLGRPLTGPASYVIGLAFSPDSRLLAVGSADKTVRLWNVADPAHPALVGTPLTGPTGYVWAVAFSPDGSTLAAGVTDGTVWLWNVADPAHPVLIATLTGPQGHVFSVAFSPSGRTLAAASNDGTVHLWDASPAAAEADVCAGAGQQLTRQEWAAYVPGLPYRAPC